MAQDSTPILEELADLASDAMSNIHDYDTGIGEFAHAAVEAIWPQLAAVINDDLVRISAIISPTASAYLGIANDRADVRRVAVTVYPNGISGSGSRLFMTETIQDALRQAEDFAVEYCSSHRVMTADDLGLSVAA